MPVLDWLGKYKGLNTGKDRSIVIHDGRHMARSQSIWFTNIETDKRYWDILLFKLYAEEPELFPHYDNYDVIEVPKTSWIPADYFGVMGVPITFLDKYNPNQFEILGIANSARWIGYECFTIINGKRIYNRILIRRRQ